MGRKTDNTPKPASSGSSALLMRVLDTISDPVLLTDPYGKVRMVLSRGKWDDCDMSCLVEGLSIDSLFGSRREAVRDWLQKLLEDFTPSNFEGIIDLPKGMMFCCLEGSPFSRFGPSSGSDQILVVMRRCHIESCEETTSLLSRWFEGVARSQRNELMGRMSPGIAHDFNNYLGGILCQISLAEMASQDIPEALAALDEAKKTIQNAKALSNRIISYMRSDSYGSGMTELGGILEESVRFPLTGSRVTFELNQAPALGRVAMPPHEVRQILVNLVHNSLQAVNGAGKLRLSASNCRGPAFQARERDSIAPSDECMRSFLHSHASEVAAIESTGSDGPDSQPWHALITVEDSGSGLPPDLGNRVFEPFVTATRGATGLGLAIVHLLLFRRGGSIEIGKSDLGGAKVFLRLPIVWEDLSQCGSASNEALEKLRILVMEDEKFVADALERVLVRLGYSVTVAYTGDEAAEYFRRPAQSPPFDLLILDLGVPGGIGGSELLTLVHRAFPAIPAIAMSGYGDLRTRDELLNTGFGGLLSKPFTVDELKRIISIALEK